MTTPAGWYPDTTGLPVQRYWDGQQWTAATIPATGGQVPPGGEGRLTIHYGFALLAIFALLGTVVPCILFAIGAANDPDASSGTPFMVMWFLWGAMWTVIWSAFAINHTLKSRR